MIQVVIGAQWGDEGKGKIVDLLSQKADVSVRFHGGNNAGHTIINNYGKFPLHLMPAGIFNTKCKTFITNGVIVDMEVLGSEIETITKVLPSLSKRLSISPRCNVIMPYHKILDKLFEEAKGKAKTGTTGRGIGPTYSDKVSYNGVRLCDFLNPANLRKRLEVVLPLKNRMITALGGQALDINAVFKSELKKFGKLKPFIRETFKPLLKAAAENKKIIFEGAQGIFLDNDWGTYPYVTASSMVAGNVNIAGGVPTRFIKKIIGISKAYTTRVGEGPFPTELNNDIGEELRKTGAEYGATTGRPRRCGWLDLEMLRFAVQLNGMTDIALTKIDILDEFKKIYVCIGYTLDGKKIDYVDCDANQLADVRPVYKSFSGWNKKISDIKNYNKLPREAKRYIRFIEKFIGIPVSIISVGPERNQTIFKR